MQAQQKNRIRFSKAPIRKKIRYGGDIVVSQALVKAGATNLIPKISVRRGDTVIVISGSEQLGKGKIGKVTKVFPKTGKIIVEGVNMITRATRKRSVTGQSGLVKKEAPIFASKVMLYDTDNKKALRADKRKALNG
jgi:large subunit ribosomal protein L24